MTESTASYFQQLTHNTHVATHVR